MLRFLFFYYFDILLAKGEKFVILCSVSNSGINTDFFKHTFTVCIGLRPLTKVLLKKNKTPLGLNF